MLVVGRPPSLDRFESNTDDAGTVTTPAPVAILAVSPSSLGAAAPPPPSLVERVSARLSSAADRCLVLLSALLAVLMIPLVATDAAIERATKSCSRGLARANHTLTGWGVATLRAVHLPGIALRLEQSHAAALAAAHEHNDADAEGGFGLAGGVAQSGVEVEGGAAQQQREAAASGGASTLTASADSASMLTAGQQQPQPINNINNTVSASAVAITVAPLGEDAAALPTPLDAVSASTSSSCGSTRSRLRWGRPFVGVIRVMAH